MSFLTDAGKAYILPMDTEEIHTLDPVHIALITRGGDIEVAEPVGTIPAGTLSVGSPVWMTAEGSWQDTRSDDGTESVRGSASP